MGNGKKIGEIISQEELKDTLDELRTIVRALVSDADLKARDLSASEFYRSDMKGYSRGINEIGNKVIDILEERLLKKNYEL